VNPAQLNKELSAKGFSLAHDQLKGLQVYLDLLLKWNRVMNLVGHSDWKILLNDLVMDSFFLDVFLRRVFKGNDRDTVLDLGAGAGLPGIPLRLVWKNGTCYLVESRLKRAAFMKQAIGSLNLENTFVLNCRAEDIQSGVLPAKLIISRAFMPWPKLLPLAGSMLGEKGMLVVLSNEKFAGQDIPGFNMLETMEYIVNNKKRYFWALESNI
jgi:16S rRNA (guanine527-N7)-methyltransferase